MICVFKIMIQQASIQKEYEIWLGEGAYKCSKNAYMEKCMRYKMMKARRRNKVATNVCPPQKSKPPQLFNQTVPNFKRFGRRNLCMLFLDENGSIAGMEMKLHVCLSPDAGKS